MQDIYAPPHGNCFAACVASILEIDDLCCVPSYFGLGRWWTHGWEPWFAARGVLPDWIGGLDAAGNPGRGHIPPRLVADVAGDYFIGAGPSPRGKWPHAVVYGPDGTVAWDPFPGGCRGILELHDAIVLRRAA